MLVVLVYPFPVNEFEPSQQVGAYAFALTSLIQLHVPCALRHALAHASIQ